jgi:hypothetical protein
MQFLATVPNGRDEVRRFKGREVLADRLTRHVKTFAQLSKTLSIGRIQAIEELAPARVRERLEHVLWQWIHFSA